MALVGFKRGTKPSDVSSLDGNTIYFFTDTQEIYLGSAPYGGNLADLKTQLGQIQTALEAKADAEDVEALEEWKITVDAALEELENAADDIEELKTTVQGHTGTLASIAGEQTTQNNKIEAIEKWLGEYYPTQTNLKAVLEDIVGGKIPDNIIETVTGSNGIKATTSSGNVTLEAVVDPESAEILEAGADGLKITLPEEATTDYTVTVATASTPTEGSAKTYEIKQGSQTYKIDIPRDLVVSEGSIVDENDEEESGTYIKLVLNNGDELYIDVADLVDEVEANNADNSIVTVTVTDGHKIGASIAQKAVTSEYLADAVNTDIAKGASAYAALTWGTV